MFFGGFYFKFQTEDEARRAARRLPINIEYYTSRQKVWGRPLESEWAPYVERDGCYVLVPGTCEVSIFEYGSNSEYIWKGENLFQRLSILLVGDDNIGDFSGQCAHRTEGYFGGDSIACSYDGKVLEFRVMSGWTKFCESCASALAAADGAGRPEPELRAIQGNPVALLNPTESCIYEGDCNLQVRYLRWGYVKGGGFERLGDDYVWDDEEGKWIRVILPPKEMIYKVRIGDKTYRLRG